MPYKTMPLYTTAMDSQKYDSCYTWIKNEIKNVNIHYIEMVKAKKN